MFEGVFLLKQIDFWTRPSQLNQTVDIEESDEDFQKLSLVLKEHAGMEFTIQSDNLRQLINEQLEQNEQVQEMITGTPAIPLKPVETGTM